MINAHQTGAYISRLRKAKDWTQQELAQKLHVTHQAVSQWEQGASFPDVALLPPLARALGVSVDDLLNGAPAQAAHSRRTSPGAIVEELARGNPGEVARLIQDDPEGVETMLTTAPLARPSQLDEVVSHLGGFAFTLRQIVDLAPFVSQEVLQSVVENARLDQIDGDTLAELAPFLGRDTLGQLVRRVTGGTLRFDQLAELAPFMDSDTLADLIQRLPDAPVTIEQVVELAPFADSATLEHLISRLEEPAQVGDRLVDLAPFLKRDSLKRAIAQLGQKLSAEELIELAPFLDKSTLDAIFRPDKH